MFHTIPSIRAKFSILEGRYLSTNTAISQLGYGVPILELASGLSTRGLHVGEESSYIYQIPDTIYCGIQIS